MFLTRETNNTNPTTSSIVLRHTEIHSRNHNNKDMNHPCPTTTTTTTTINIPQLLQCALRHYMGSKKISSKTKLSWNQTFFFLFKTFPKLKAPNCSRSWEKQDPSSSPVELKAFLFLYAAAAAAACSCSSSVVSLPTTLTIQQQRTPPPFSFFLVWQQPTATNTSNSHQRKARRVSGCSENLMTHLDHHHQQQQQTAS